MGSKQAQTRVQPDRNDQKYFTVTPHLVWVVSRDPYDYMFWSVVKMIAGDNGECALSAEDMAKACGMGINKVVDCRSYLIAQGLLIGELTDEGGTRSRATWHLRIPDLWPRNVAWRSEVGDSLYARIQARQDFHRDRVEGFPSRGEGFPSRGEGFPSRGEGFPSRGEGFPSRGEGCQPELHCIENQQEEPLRKTIKENDDDARRARANGADATPAPGSSSSDTWESLVSEFGQEELTEAQRLAGARSTDFRYVRGILKNRARRGAAPAARRGTGRRDPYDW